MKASESLQNEQSTATENALRRAVDTTPAFIHTARPDGYLDYFNRGWLDFLGKSLEEVCGWRWTESVHPDDVDGIVQKWRAALASGEPFEAEARVRCADGTYHALLHRKVPLHDEHGNIVKWFGSSSDIEDRKRAEKELRNSEQKYRDLVDTTPAFVHTNLPNGDLDFVNRGWLEYLGLSKTDLLGSRWTSAIHPEDVEELVAKWRAALESGEGYVAEARVRRADGEYRWFLHREEPLRNEAGEIVKWYGSAIEIQERKIAEQKIREQEIELRQILDLAPQHVMVYGPDGSPLYANQVALEYCGVGLEQLLGESRIDFVHPAYRERYLADREKGLSEGTPHEYETRLLRHDGKFRWFLVRRNPLKDEQGHITRWFVTATDIEDRKQAEENLRYENIVLREELGKTSMFEEVIGTSSALQSILARAAKVAPTDSTVLIMGETGTGKELIARAIHKRSKRSERPFISVNCAAIPSSLIMSELFGHEKGAFTGAVQRRSGKFELGEGGTIFLDEVGDLPPETQIALLRVLQEREFERVGGTEVLRADVRVISATNRDLQEAIADGAFRSDLYYRLNVFPIKLPPLRDRREDVPLLVSYFVDRYAKRAGKKIEQIQKKSLEALQEYSWPGNVRELQNVIERSLIIAETNVFSIDKSWLANEPQPSGSLPTDQKVNERKRIETALAQSNGKVSGTNGAAARLGIPASTLESKIRVLRINKLRFKGV
jgi:formate hydrogenlyase transcriptional activator